MADIELVVKIPESIWVAIQNGEYCGILDDRTYNAIKNGIPLPKGYDAEWINNKCSTCGKGVEDLIDSREWYENEKPSYCPFCGKRFKESE